MRYALSFLYSTISPSGYWPPGKSVATGIRGGDVWDLAAAAAAPVFFFLGFFFFFFFAVFIYAHAQASANWDPLE